MRWSASADASVRAAAGFFGVLWAAGAIRSLFGSPVDLNLWFFDLRPLPGTVGQGLVLGAATGMILAAVRPQLVRPARFAVGTLTALLAVAALSDTLGFYRLRSQGAFSGAFPLPLSLLVFIGLCALTGWMLRVRQSRPVWQRGVIPGLITLSLLAVLLPLAQMLCFGRTDYRRPADVAVVLGARAYADGRPSDALADRVRTGCRLYEQGLVPRLLFSGGPGDGAVHETKSMRRMALSLGVPDSAIELDPQGVNTLSTAANTAALAPRRGWSRALVVSHAYHLPRVKLAFQAQRMDVLTVPAEETYVLTKMPVLVAREVAAWWVYWGRTLGSN